MVQNILTNPSSHTNRSGSCLIIFLTHLRFVPALQMQKVDNGTPEGFDPRHVQPRTLCER